MRTRLRSKVTLLFIVCAALLTVGGTAMAITADPSGTTSLSPSIQSDKADYAPGELVTLTGGNWQPGESVNIVVNDDAGQTWNRNVDVNADDSGNITDSFNLPDWFVATYSVTATGPSGTATTSFTDGNVSVRTSGPTVTLTYEKWSGNGCTGTMTASGTTSINSTSGQIAALAGDTGSVKVQVPSTAGTKNFENWTATAGGGTSTNNPWCLNSVTGNRTFTATYGPPEVTIDNVTPSPAIIGVGGNATIIWHADANGPFSVRFGGTDCNSGTVVSGPTGSGNYNNQPTLRFTTVSASSLSEGDNTIRVCVTDSAGVTGSATTTVTKDTTAPTVQSIKRAGSNPTNASSVDWTVTFSESVTGVNTGDFVVANTGLGTPTPAVTGVHCAYSIRSTSRCARVSEK